MKLGIGTAQFGLDYGISNQGGKTPPEEVYKIIELANQNTVRVIDTAQLYGNSEKVLGNKLPLQHNFDIITKTPQFCKLTVTKYDAHLLKTTFYQSLSKLQQSSIYALLIHNADDLLADNGHLLMEEMLSLKQQGLIKKIGVSVYNGEQIDRILCNYSIDLIQLPINVLDQRLLLSGHLSKLKKLNIEIHARSLFLQGLLLMPLECIPPYFDTIKEHLVEYHSFINQQGFSPIEAALSFGLSINEIDTFICGVNNYQHFQEILACFNKEKSIIGKVLTKFALADCPLLNPYDWKV